MKLLSFAHVVCAISHISGSVATSETSPRTRYNFNPGWKVYVGDEPDASDPSFDDSNWKNVTLPYAWNEDEAFRLDIANLSTGVAWYRKHFLVPSGHEGQKLFLEFEGIRHGGEFYVNGNWIGRSENGVMAFGFDITNVTLTGDAENVIAARIDNDWDYREVETGQRYQWADRNFYANYGGINKNVYLHATRNLYQTLPLYSNLGTTGTYVYATDIDVRKREARVTVETEVRNEGAADMTFVHEVVIEDQRGDTVATFAGGEHTIGANETQVIRASEALSNLNFWSWGYGYLYTVHSTLKVDGEKVDTTTTRTGFRKTEFANGMFKLNDRTLHVKGYAQRTTNEWPALGSAVPAWLSDFSNALMLKSHGALVRWMHVTPWRQDVESLDRLGLLQALPAGDSEGDVTGRRWEQRVELMRDAIIYNRNSPSVVFYEAGNKGVSEEHMAEMKALRDQYDPHGGRASGSREMLDSEEAEYGGEMLYIDKSTDIPLWAHEYSRDEGLRKYWDEYSPPYHPDGEGPLYKDEDASSYNRNQDSHAIEDVVRWYDYWEMRPGTGERVNAGGVNIVFSDTNTHHRGAENYRRSGEVDPMRLPKDGWYAHQVMWDAWVDVERSATHLIGHWNYNSSTTKNITVVSTAEEVELFLNGESLGVEKPSYRFLFTFTNISWEAGELRAVGYGPGEANSEDVRITAGEPAAVKLTPTLSPSGFRADGADIALVDVEVVDSHGMRCPTALNMVNFTLRGEATWRGGIAQGPDNYILSMGLPVENGVNRVMLRSTTVAGDITLEASSEGLESALIKLATMSVSVADGLGLDFSDSGLPSDLSRSPTPDGESYTQKRRALHVESSRAGSSASNSTPEMSYDDNAYSLWTSGSAIADAWVEYSFGRVELVNQAVLKLSGFRTTSYPLQIVTGGEVLWDGITEKNLGYVTLNFNLTEATSIRIASTDGVLKVVEAEFYGPLDE